MTASVISPVAHGLSPRAQIVASAAGQHAAAVDRDARFPAEAFDALREQRLLSMLVSVALGGDGASVIDVMDVCYALGAACASAAMIFAMHQIQVAILMRHARNSAWHQHLLRRLCNDQLLFASSTTENQTGGVMRASACALETAGEAFTLVKNATVMSYGAEADGVFVTARRSPDAVPSDQVLVGLLKEDYELERIKSWDAMGMRGTCSTGYTVRARCAPEQVLPEPYDRIHAQTMVPVAHLTWSSVWAGVAAGAVGRARRFIRGSAAQSKNQLPPGAARLPRAMMSLRALRANITATGAAYMRAAADDGVDALDFQTAINLLKVDASETAIATVLNALQACGLSGYRNDDEFSVARSMRDILSSSIMINNDRILANAAPTLLLFDVPSTLSD
ncbi:MAG: acyl-CoA dehydrogenase family protein [Gemmatimonadaceae bacterium]